MKATDHTGQRFGRLMVIERCENHQDGKAAWICKCDCGRECVAVGSRLRRGTKASCGCLKKEGRDKFFQRLQYDRTQKVKRFGHQVIFYGEPDLDSGIDDLEHLS